MIIFFSLWNSANNKLLPPYWNLIFLSALRLAAISQQLQQDSVQELTNQFLWSTNTLFSSAGFTLDCCHGSTNLPMSIRQGQSVWQRYCLERWFTLHSLNSQEACVCDFVCVCMYVCVPDCLLFEFFFVCPPSREKQAYESSTQCLSQQAEAPIKED